MSPCKTQPSLLPTCLSTSCESGHPRRPRAQRWLTCMYSIIVSSLTAFNWRESKGVKTRAVIAVTWQEVEHNFEEKDGEWRCWKCTKRRLNTHVRLFRQSIQCYSLRGWHLLTQILNLSFFNWARRLWELSQRKKDNSYKFQMGCSDHCFLAVKGKH